MKVNRIVANVNTPDFQKAERFYHDILGLEPVMDLGWYRVLGSSQHMPVQLGFGTEGGSGSPLPDLSIEVDDLDEALKRCMDAEINIEYGPVSEPWGATRFYVYDPLGRLINILQHA